MDEFVNCDICMEIYDGGLRCPRVFSCGHSFCSLCIQKLLATFSCCPTCKLPIEEESLDSVSINYVLKQIAEKYLCGSTEDTSNKLLSKERECKTQLKVDSLPYKGYCKVHKVPKRFRCMTCSVWVCGDCVAITHKLCKTLLVKEAIAVMKEEKNIQIIDHMATISKGEVESSNLLDHYKVIWGFKNEELQRYQQKIIVLKEEICEVNRNIEKVTELQTVLTYIKEKLEYQMNAISNVSTANDLDMIEEKLTKHFSSLQDAVENIKLFKSSTTQTQENNLKVFLNNKEKLMATVAAGERIFVTAEEGCNTSYGKLDVKEGIFRIHCFKQVPHPPSPLCITLDYCLTTMTGRKDWPKKIFLQFSSNGLSLGDVIIRLDDSSKQATKTVLRLCLFGEEGNSFGGIGLCSRLLNFSGFKGEFICSKEMLPVPSDVDSEEILKESKEKIWNEGEMCLQLSNWNDKYEFDFWIFSKGINSQWELIPIGQVEKGIEVIKDTYRRSESGESFKIVNCGWDLS